MVTHLYQRVTPINLQYKVRTFTRLARPSMLSVPSVLVLMVLMGLYYTGQQTVA
jgi:hypothetical protein